MIIGITGGIGSGKSTILNYLKDKYGYEIIETDRLGHEIMEPGTKAYDEIVRTFGDGIIDGDRKIDRKKLGNIVFGNEEKLKILNKITHEAVIDEIKNIIDRKKKEEGKENFIVETALMYESGCDRMCDKVWYVYANRDARVKRLMESRDLSEEKIENIMARQLDEDEFIKRADACIDNSGDIDKTHEQLEKLLVI